MQDVPYKLFLRGNIVKIRQEFQDPGDEEFTWIVLCDEEKDRVDISAIDSPLAIKHTQTVQTNWIEHISK